MCLIIVLSQLPLLCAWCLLFAHMYVWNLAMLGHIRNVYEVLARKA
jgi:hypothetical protein